MVLQLPVPIENGVSGVDLRFCTLPVARWEAAAEADSDRSHERGDEDGGFERDEAVLRMKAEEIRHDTQYVGGRLQPR
jgi:hypothetical protein